jgi:ribosomal protein S21
MISVKRKDDREANENLLRRFNRRVLQSGLVANAKAAQRFSKPISKTERRKAAIIREQRKEHKAEQIRLGLVKAR